MLRLISLVNLVARLASDGNMSEGPGTSSTSSKVRPVLICMDATFCCGRLPPRQQRGDARDSFGGGPCNQSRRAAPVGDARLFRTAKLCEAPDGWNRLPRVMALVRPPPP